jgi:alkylated DNA repair dioxygenase AlkB
MPLLLSALSAMPDAEIVLYPDFFSAAESDAFLQEILAHIAWSQETIRLWGKTIALPRLTAWYGDPGKSYTYSGITLHPDPWTSTLLAIKRRIDEVAAVRFNSVLLNLYRDGRDSVSWHSDDEPELGQHPIIGSVSFGATRRFQFKHKQRRTRCTSVELSHGSVLLMQGATQHHWLHRIPKTPRACGPRINLTFRIIQ